MRAAVSARQIARKDRRSQRRNRLVRAVVSWSNCRTLQKPRQVDSGLARGRRRRREDDQVARQNRLVRPRRPRTRRGKARLVLVATIRARVDQFDEVTVAQVDDTNSALHRQDTQKILAHVLSSLSTTSHRRLAAAPVTADTATPARAGQNGHIMDRPST